MRKGKVGLQKEISRIFTGIMMPKKGAPENPVTSSPPADGLAAAGTAVPKPAVPKPLTPTPKPLTPTTKCAASLTGTVAPTTKPVAPAPNPAAPPVQAPKPFVIPEPTHPAGPGGYAGASQAGDSQNTYSPPTPNQNVYEPPPLPKPVGETVKIGVIAGQKGTSPILKIWHNFSAKLLTSKSAGTSSARQKVMRLLVPVLAIVFIYVMFKILRKPAAAPPKPKPGSGAVVSAASDGKVTWEQPPVYPDNLRDPTVFGAVTVSTGEENTGRPPVKGIVFSEDNPIAVVGDRIVSVGEIVQGATVVKINPESVEFEMGDKKWTQEVER